jgi:transposase-like protein
LREYRKSRLTVAAFCRRAGVSQPSFYAWRRRLCGEATFAEVKVPREAAAEAGGIELRLPGERCVVLRPGFDRRTLLDLLDVLRVAGETGQEAPA